MTYGPPADAERTPPPRHALAPLPASAVGLSVVAALAPVQKAEFGRVRDLVEITDSTLTAIAGTDDPGRSAARD
ncbi:hypothetical protein [Streptomyces sp. AB3(2024)]|uniref:hypothetical protein n=1 Tax=Streptomyces sp. AB3(2024) TaxID=3317321 RepID=UPI0035A3CB56